MNCGCTRSYNCAFIEGGVVKTFRLHRGIQEKSVNPKVWIPTFCNLYYYIFIGRLALLKRNSLDLVLSKEGCGGKARCLPAAVSRACCPVNVFIFSFRRNCSFDCQVMLGVIKAVKLLATVFYTVLWSQAPIFSFFAITM